MTELLSNKNVMTLTCPVQVLIWTQPAQLQKIHPTVDKANTRLIEKLCVQLSGSIDTTEIRHLITKISDKKKSEQVNIVFDYDISMNKCWPLVMAFNVKADGLTLTIKQLFNPQIDPKVNETIKW